MFGFLRKLFLLPVYLLAALGMMALIHHFIINRLLPFSMFGGKSLLEELSDLASTFTN